MDEKVRPGEFPGHIAKLKAGGRMPTLESVLAAVADSRKKYKDAILESRKQGDNNASEGK